MHCVINFRLDTGDTRVIMDFMKTMPGETVTIRATAALAEAAHAWWLNKRPVAWTEAHHLARPEINTTCQAEAKLAMEVARAVRKRRSRQMIGE